MEDWGEEEEERWRTGRRHGKNVLQHLTHHTCKRLFQTADTKLVIMLPSTGR